jgi:hypothetical protein
MVAIHSPSAESEWFGGALPRPDVPSPADQARRRDAAQVATRRLPDRATRVRRRRLAVLVLALAVATATWSGARALSSLTEAGASTRPEAIDRIEPGSPLASGAMPEVGQRYVVRAGDTLWSIAAQLAPGADPRPVVDALRAANGDAALQAGDVITLDVG